MYVFITTVSLFLAIFSIALLALLIASRVLQRKQVAFATGEPADSLLALPFLLKEQAVSSISPWATVLERFDFTNVIRQRLSEADLNWSVGRVSAMMLLSGSVAPALLSRSDLVPVVAQILLAVGFAALPYLYILRARRRRFEKFEAQFPDALDSMIRALRAGHPFATAMEMLGAEALPPLSGEMRKTVDEWKLGMTWDQALDNLVRRVPVLDVSIFVAAVRLQIKTGGRLGEVLAKLAESMRENSAIQGEVKSMAAHGKLTGLVLTILPVFIGGMMFYVNPAQMFVLLEHPVGKQLIWIAVACLIAAHFVIRKIVDIRL
ncbi:MAG TPA: type II secretion system F family protein [Bryobacteraceae bacterium]|nr:type II secretion system F family protein [Bryobacteraceae bacterium]